MVINKAKDGTSLVIKLEGRLDTMTAPELEKEINTSLEGITALTFDFEKLDYVSSAGLRVLIIAYKTMRYQGDMKIVNANEIIREVFQVTGFTNILHIN